MLNQPTWCACTSSKLLSWLRVTVEHTLSLHILAGQNVVNQQIPAAGRFTFVHVLHRQELQMPMWLTGSTVLARIEEGKQTLLLAARLALPCFQASVRRL
jgi:hypothetical protein